MAAPMKKEGAKRRKPKNRKTKIHVVFDEDKRKEFLGGFRKRKDERKRKGREELELKLKEEKKQILKERKEMLLQMFQQQRDITEVEKIVEPITYDLEEHTVTISSLNEVDFQGQSDLLLGQNKDCETDSDQNEQDEKIQIDDKERKNHLKIVQKSNPSKKVTSTKAFRLKQKLQQKKSQTKVRKKKKILKKRDKHRGGKGQNN